MEYVFSKAVRYWSCPLSWNWDRIIQPHMLRWAQKSEKILPQVVLEPTTCCCKFWTASEMRPCSLQQWKCCFFGCCCKLTAVGDKPPSLSVFQLTYDYYIMLDGPSHALTLRISGKYFLVWLSILNTPKWNKCCVWEINNINVQPLHWIGLSMNGPRWYNI